jgi:membrane protein required for colicin V production
LQLGLLKNNVVQASVTFPFLQPLGPKIINSIGKILPFFKNMFVQLEMFFGHLAQ